MVCVLELSGWINVRATFSYNPIKVAGLGGGKWMEEKHSTAWGIRFTICGSLNVCPQTDKFPISVGLHY